MINQVNKLIALDKTEEALELIETEYNGKNKNITNKLVIIKADNHKNNEMMQKNIISKEVGQRNRNRINSSLQSLVSNPIPEPNLTNIVQKQEHTPTKTYWKYISITLAVALILGLIYILFNPNDIKTNFQLEDKVFTLAFEELNDEIYRDYQNFYIGGAKSLRSKISKEALTISNQLESIKDSRLSLSYQIYKYVALVTANKINAITSTETNKIIEFTNTGLENISFLKKLIKEVDSIENIQEKLEIREWLDSEEHILRIQIIEFILKAINLKSNGEYNVEAVKMSYHKFKSAGILIEKGYSQYPIVKELVKEGLIEL